MHLVTDKAHFCLVQMDFFSQRTSIKRITMLVWHAPLSNSFSCCLWLPTISIPFAPAVFCHFIVVSSCIWPFWVVIHTQKASTSKEFAECVCEGLVWHPPSMKFTFNKFPFIFNFSIVFVVSEDLFAKNDSMRPHSFIYSNFVCVFKMLLAWKQDARFKYGTRELSHRPIHIQKWKKFEIDFQT